MKSLNKFLAPIIYGVTVLMLVIYLFNYNSKNPGPSTELGLVFSYVLFFIVIGAILLGFVLVAVTDTKSIMKSLIGTGAVLVVALIAYLMSGNEVNEVYKKFNVDAGLSQIIGGGLFLSVLMMAFVVIAIIYTEVKNAVK